MALRDELKKAFLSEERPTEAQVMALIDACCDALEMAARACEAVEAMAATTARIAEKLGA